MATIFVETTESRPGDESGLANPLAPKEPLATVPGPDEAERDRLRATEQAGYRGTFPTQPPGEYRSVSHGW